MEKGVGDEQIGQTREEAPTEPHGEGGGSHATDWKSEARKWEARAKENKAAAARADEASAEAERVKAEAEAARAEAEAARAEADRLKAEKARAEAVKAAAEEAGVDAELLSLMAGDTPDLIAANAETLKAKIAALPVYPSVPDNGAGASPAMSKDQIMEIKNPAERVRQIAAHPALFAD